MSYARTTYLSRALGAMALLLAACAPAAPAAQPPAAPITAAVPTKPPAAASPAAGASPAVPAKPAASPMASPAAAASPSAAAKPAAAPNYPTITIAAKPDVVRIAYQAIPNSERLAKQLQLHEQSFGTRIEWREFNSGRDVNTAMASGAVDFGLVGTSPAAAGIAQDLPYEVIAIYDIIGDNEALVAKPGINTIADLRGKKVAAPFGSTTHYSLLKALQLNNINPRDLTIIDMSPTDMVAAWTRGDIDAGYNWQPALGQMVDAGGKIILTSREMSQRGFPTGDISVVRKDFSQKYPDLVAAYLQDLSKATDLFRSDPARAAAAMAKEFNLPEPTIRAQMNELVWLNSVDQLSPQYFGSSSAPGELPKVMKDTGDFLVEQKTIRSAPELSVYQQAVPARYLERSVGR